MYFIVNKQGRIFIGKLMFSQQRIFNLHGFSLLILGFNKQEFELVIIAIWSDAGHLNINTFLLLYNYQGKHSYCYYQVLRVLITKYWYSLNYLVLSSINIAPVYCIDNSKS